MVGTTGFEPTTSSTPRKRATKLRYVPTTKHIISYFRNVVKIQILAYISDEVFDSILRGFLRAVVEEQDGLAVFHGA